MEFIFNSDGLKTSEACSAMDQITSPTLPELHVVSGLPLPMKQAARLTLHHTWTAMIHNKQYIIYNLQEMCFIKKEARPNPAHLRIPSARPIENSN